MNSPPLPESTYRLQFHRGFTFRDATEIVPYLAKLGVTHVYASPYLKARPGSTHGYDVIDHCSLNPELGSEADYRAWVDAMREHGMSHILDIVPNHVGINTPENKWWNDVLEHGRSSKYADYFDIAWRGSSRLELHDKVLLPVLGAMYGDVLDRGELKLVREDGKLFVRYYDHRFPIDPQTAPSDEKKLTTDELHDLLERQHYRLAYWRTAGDEINYRRFFDINDLAALNMQRQDVFDATHRFILQLVAEGTVTGLRVDHPDGLLDPRQYFQRLQERHPGVYVVVEKILAFGEPLPSDWPVHGTSGYDFLNMVNGLFVDPSSEAAFTELYEQWNDQPFEEIVYQSKRLILETSLSGELHMLARQLDRIAQHDTHTRDFTFNGLLVALREMIACFPVYRSYISAAGMSESDEKHIEQAMREAARRNPRIEPTVFEFVRNTLLRIPRGPEAEPDDALRFAGKFQQLTAPVTAKGVEDTAFYLYNRFISLNEVGGDPSHFGVSPEQLHAHFRDRQQHWPYALSTLSTHDTKRSEDVRARLNVLSEIPGEWRDAVLRWMQLNDRHRDDVEGSKAPDRNDEYLLYQTLVGAWGGEHLLNRVQAYMTKAMREAKARTNWTDPNQAYEAAVMQFAGRILDEQSGAEFLREFVPFQQRVARHGVINSLAQTLLRLAAPGVPDTYQGTDVLDFSLVDPDNRRPVDYARRQKLLDGLYFRNDDPDRMKLLVTTSALRARRDRPGLFSAGEYLPVHVNGIRAEQVFAFARQNAGSFALVVVPRFVTRLADATTLPIGLDVWQGTQLQLPTPFPKEPLVNAFTGERVDPAMREVGSILSQFPVALLLSS
jgi:(1->4)-alpha-D-glucan 1-alpha-D-glucosylmutase